MIVSIPVPTALRGLTCRIAPIGDACRVIASRSTSAEGLMRYKRLATFILVAGLGLVAGCRSNSCEGGLMSRFGFNRNRATPCCDAGVIGTPVSGNSWGGEMPYDGSYDGPVLGDPTFMGTPQPPIMPNVTPIPGTTLPPPTADGFLRPVPGTNVPGTATPIPAGPSSRSRW